CWRSEFRRSGRLEASEPSPHSSSLDRVLHECGNRHGANAPRNRRDHGGHFLNSALIHVANPDVTTLFEILETRVVVSKQSLDLSAIGHFVGANIDYNSAGLDPVAGYERDRKSTRLNSSH